MKRFGLSVICRIFLLLAIILPAGCSVYVTRFYSHPESHASRVIRDQSHYRLNPRLERFSAQKLSDTFIDTIEGIVVRIRFENEQSRFVFGPPVIPVLAVWDDYGSSSNKTVTGKTKSRNANEVTLQLTIESLAGAEISFDASLFAIQKRSGADYENQLRVTQIYQDSIPLVLSAVSILVNQTQQVSWKLVFNNAVYPDENPLLQLNSLQINHHPVYTEGIPFQLKKANFYSALISING